MRIVFLSYNYSADVDSPRAWFERLRYYLPWLELVAKDHSVIRVDHINYAGTETHNGVTYHFLNDGKPGYFPFRLHKFVKDLRPDVVVVSSFMFPLQLLQLRHALGNGVRIIVQNHAEKTCSGVKKILQRLASSRVNHFLFASAETGHEWIRNGNIIPSANIVELMEVSSTFKPAAEKSIQTSPVFLWVGRLNENKDPVTVVRAFLQFAEMNRDAKLYMIYQSDELLGEIEKVLRAPSPIVLLGKKPHDELQKWYNDAGFFVSGSHHEGSGTALCEAMSCGCIPIVTDIPSFRSITGNCGLRYKAGEQQALLAAFQRTLNINRAQEAQKVLMQFKERLSFEAIAERFQQLLSAQANNESTRSQTASIGQVSTGE